MSVPMSFRVNVVLKDVKIAVMLTSDATEEEILKQALKTAMLVLEKSHFEGEVVSVNRNGQGLRRYPEECKQ